MDWSPTELRHIFFANSLGEVHVVDLTNRKPAKLWSFDKDLKVKVSTSFQK